MSNSRPAVEVEPPPVPRTFRDYLRSFGPGLIVVLTWLGAGDIVESGTAGGNYGYSLMWVLVVALVIRYLFVSLIAKYQLCNQHGEDVLDGLARLHSVYPPLLLAAAVIMGHIYCAYMTVGIGEACVNITGLGKVWMWGLFWNPIALFFVFRPAMERIELVFKVFLALLTISFIGTAAWIGLNPGGMLGGLFSFEVPKQQGEFAPLLIATGMIGAVGGSLMNLVYPYFLAAKGWRGAQYLPVQRYDLLLAMFVMVILNLAIWTLGAEVLFPNGLTIREMDDLPKLLSQILGQGGRLLFYLGIFSAIYTSLLGHAIGLAYMGSHAWLRWNAGQSRLAVDFRSHPLYRFIAVWCLVTPLVWTVPGMPGFVTLTLLSNSIQVVLLPLIAGGLWCITARSRYIGRRFCNRWWENLVMALLFVLACVSAWKAVESVIETLSQSP